MTILESIERASGPSRELDWRIADMVGHPAFALSRHIDMWPPFQHGSKLDKGIPHYTSSLDAAMTLARNAVEAWEMLYVAGLTVDMHAPSVELWPSIKAALIVALKAPAEGGVES